MFVVFRTDANPTIGTGHLMRCLALANTLAAEGQRCLFLCRAAGLGALAERIRQAGHDLRLLPEGRSVAAANDDPPHGAWLPHGWAADLALCRQALAGEPVADWLVVDHYAVDARWEGTATFARRRLIIDDLADRPHVGNLLLDSGLHADPATPLSAVAQCRLPAAHRAAPRPAPPGICRPPPTPRLRRHAPRTCWSSSAAPMPMISPDKPSPCSNNCPNRGRQTWWWATSTLTARP